jgi:hypothetical protein
MLLVFLPFSFWRKRPLVPVYVFDVLYGYPLVPARPLVFKGGMARDHQQTIKMRMNRNPLTDYNE